jgi:hypothetical protein
MPVIAQISFCASFRSVRPKRLIHIKTAAIGWRKIESKISNKSFTLWREFGADVSCPAGFREVA